MSTRKRPPTSAPPREPRAPGTPVSSAGDTPAGGALAPTGTGALRKETRRRVVAVTGASSFLGSNLVALLEEDPTISRVVAVDIEPPPTAAEKTRSYEVDFTRPTADARLAEVLAAEKVDTLVHLAFLASPSHASAWAHELESVGTMHVLYAARHAKIRKVVMWSQTLLYGASPSNPNYLTERHPLNAPRERFFLDKIEAEVEASRFAQRSPDSTVTILRTAPILGPTVNNALTRYLSRRFVPTMMGFDPLMQFLHEIDAIAAFKLAVDRDVPGTFNIVGDGVLPLSTVVKLAGRIALPIPHPIAESLANALWLAQLSEAPKSFLRYLRFICVADGARAKRKLGFSPTHSAREAVLDFTNAQRLRDVRLLEDSPA